MVVVAFIGGIGGQELLLILGAALVIFGPKRLPELARGIGKITAQVRAANRQIQRELYSNLEVGDLDTEAKGQRPRSEERPEVKPAGEHVEQGAVQAQSGDDAETKAD